MREVLRGDMDLCCLFVGAGRLVEHGGVLGQTQTERESEAERESDTSTHTRARAERKREGESTLPLAHALEDSRALALQRGVLGRLSRALCASE